MAQVIDIREKLGMAGRPRLIVADGVEVEVDNTATTVMQALAAIGDGKDIDPSSLMEVYGLMFDATARKKLDKLHLDFADFTVLVSAAVEAVMGSAEGEA